MLTMVEVFSSSGESLALPLQDTSDGYLVQEINGLDPVKATIVSTKLAQMDSTQYQSSRRETRNILMNLGIVLNEDSPVQTLRRNLYKFLMPKSNVTLRFYFDDVAFVDISGRVESHDAPLFSQDPEVNISLLCFDPDFYALNSVVVNGSTTSTTTELVVAYPGSTETGFILTLSVDRSLDGFFIYNTVPGNLQQAFEFDTSLVAGDVVKINTIPGSRSAILTRAAVDSSLLYAVSAASSWPLLFPGDNGIRVFATGAAIPYTIEYKAKYGGL